MDTYELKNAFSQLYADWEVATRGGYYAYQSSIGKRKAVLYAAVLEYLPRLEALEALIPGWADRRKVRGIDEQAMWKRAARIRQAIRNTDPDNVRVLLPV